MNNKIKCGQIWQDSSHTKHRWIRIIEILDSKYAKVQNIETGKFTKVLLSNLNESKKGYKLFGIINKQLLNN